MWKVNMRTRDYRRHQRDRKIARVAEWMRTNNLNWGYASDDEFRDSVMRIYKHPRVCSQWCCGNPRKWFGTKTVAETRAGDYEIDE